MRPPPLVAGLFLCAAALSAQSPAAGPAALLLPVSARVTGLGGATIRDDYAIFYDPARITPTSGIGLSIGRYDMNGTTGAIASTVNVGPLNYGWGVTIAQFRAPSGATYPFAPADLAADGVRPVLSLAATAAAEYTFKRFNLGVGVTFAEDRVDATGLFPASATPSAAIESSVLLGNVGVAHALWGGTAEVAVLNIGDRSSFPAPTTAKLGWARPISTNQFDFVFAADATEHNGWYGGGGGAEVSWGWIEGFSAALRAGARRPETDGQKPMTVGASFNADRLALDYALEFFDGGRYAHIISVRWR
jgi:hypothetical protein